MPQEVGNKDEDKIQSYVDHPDAPLLDEDTPVYEEYLSRRSLVSKLHAEQNFMAVIS